LDGATRTQTAIEGAGDTTAPWWLILASSDGGVGVGAREQLGTGDRLVLGRGTQVGEAVLPDPRLSREHSELRVDDEHRMWIKDLASRNGTFVNEQRAELQRVYPGDIVGIGSLLFVVERHDPADDVGAHPTLVGLSAEHRCVLGQVRQVSAMAAPVLVTGEVGAGKSFVARAIHEASGRRGELVELACGTIPEAHVQTELFGFEENAFAGADQARVGLLERADGGTLLLDAVGAACAPLQDCLSSFIGRKTARRLGADQPRELDVRVIATCHAGDLHRVHPELRTRLSAWTIELPPLRERRIDIPALAERFAAEAGEGAGRFHYSAMARLLRYDWPGNAEELCQVVARAVVEAEGERPIPMTPSIAKLGLPEVGAERQRPPVESISSLPAEAFIVSFDGRWFRPPNGERVDLSRRHNLALIVKALADRRRDDNGGPLAIGELLELGWPGVKLVPESGNNRAYVALTTLRKLGLADLLERGDDGYRFTRDVPMLTHWGEG
jgi:pSer/pThr/pTyr-binding forkhead associated (FHA) protein